MTHGSRPSNNVETDADVNEGRTEKSQELEKTKVSELEAPQSVSTKRPNAKSDGDSHRSKQPKLTAQDVQVARETAELFKSNIFKLEIDELVHVLKLKDSHCKLMEKVLHRLYDMIQEIPASDELSLEDANVYFKQSATKVSIPFPDPKPTSLNYKFKYETPEDISLVGSFGLKTGIQQPSGMSIDVALTMPHELLQPKDYMNYRALYKRAFYLAYVAEHLAALSEEKHLPIKLSYEYADGDVLCPVIKVQSSPSDSPTDKDVVFDHTGFSIKLYVGFPLGIFEAKKLLPDRNCIRVKAEEVDVKDLPPTPLYNSSILSSGSYTCFLKYLYTAKKTAESFRDACVLGKLWLKQRGFSSDINEGGFGHFEFVTLMAALLEGGGESGNRILLHGFSSYQMFKATIRYLSIQDLCSHGHLSFSSLLSEHRSVYKANGFDVPTIFDKNTKLNILWKMTPSSYNMLRLYANSTLELLNDVVRDRFPQTFITKANNKVLKYDIFIQIPLSEINQEDSFGPLEKISFITFETFVCSKIFKILSGALRNRVTQISVSVSSTSSLWPIAHRKPLLVRNQKEKYIDIGLSLDPAESEKKVTKGPLHSQKAEGEKFSSFWGSRAQVRRYKDGSIQYSCLWTASSESPTVTIVKYILDLHLTEGISSNMIVNSSNFNLLLPRSLTLSTANSHPLVMPSHFQQLRSSYDDLCKIVYHMTNLPLTVKSILPASSALRGMSLLLPVPFAIANPDFFNESIVQFETSTRWPDEIMALERTKTAFLLKINESINKHKGYSSFLSTDNEIPYLKDVVTSLEVLTPEGYGFKFRILTERDETLYLRSIENADTRQKQAVTDCYFYFMRKYIGCVKHHRAFSSLVTRYPFFGPTVRLFKQWLESQLLYPHFSEELIELIAVKCFIDPAPYSIPGSVGTGFLRILDFVSRWNWREDALILDLSGDSEDPDATTGSYIDKLSGKLTVQEYQGILENFKKLRKEDPSGTNIQFFVASKQDPSGKLWSCNNLGLPIASRLTALSKAAIGLFTKSVQFDSSLIMLVFTSALKDYDFVIKVKAPMNLRAKSGVLPIQKFKNLIRPLTQFPGDPSQYGDPLQSYFAELKARYSNVAILSCHRYTGLYDTKEGCSNVITGIFNPAVARGEKKFRANIGFNIKPTEDEHVECNRESILNQMVCLGGDLVVSFEKYH
ncbi:hypothetical protein FOA43_001394 [Brettanomyces nanus]|uniref:U3 small nucleolar RNA-associated protein 22 n=1 Tax=Eeniella nana TaxID=13502 RepID=A0A875RZI6_EENNA|nr:uncharacterized protein FOA43_001394 [Brettanomyces nanus]QPG74073.1 hypothetical protein FOA43_001394 [Brettanomyces nanus]